MPSVSEKQREAMAIAEHEPSKLYKRNRAMKSMSHKQLHEFASSVKSKALKNLENNTQMKEVKDHSWNEWHNKKDRYKRTGTTIKEKALRSRAVGKGKSHITGNVYNP